MTAYAAPAAADITEENTDETKNTYNKIPVYNFWNICYADIEG